METPAEASQRGSLSSPVKTSQRGSVAQPAEASHPAAAYLPNSTVQPAEASQYGSGGQPAEASQYRDGGQPAEASQYGSGGQPAEASQYGSGGQPAEASQYGSGGQPAEASQYGSGGQPAEASQYGDGGQPAEASQYGDGGQPAEASQYGDEGQPAEASQYGDEGQPAEASQYGSGGQPAEASQYRDGGQPAEASQYGDGGQPAEASQYGDGGQPAEASQYGDGGQPAEASQYGDEGQPAEASQYGSGGQPAEASHHGRLQMPLVVPQVATAQPAETSQRGSTTQSGEGSQRSRLQLPLVVPQDATVERRHVANDPQRPGPKEATAIAKEAPKRSPSVPKAEAPTVVRRSVSVKQEVVMEEPRTGNPKDPPDHPMMPTRPVTLEHPMTMDYMPSCNEVPMRIASFNLWGIFNSKIREARMKLFASKVEHYDIILLQEQFSPDDFQLIFRSAPKEVQETYYFRRFRSSFYGSGCAVISRYPIKQTFFHTFPLQGYPEMVLHGDFFANKGAAMVRVQVPVPGGPDGEAVALQEVTLYTTHLVAIYQKVSQLHSWKQERYLPFRISQAISFANLILSTSRPTDRIIIGGDFNSSQRSLEVQMMLILLKKHGYDMRSVLPLPRTLLDEAKTEEERDQALRLFTFSNRNPFNTMKTSYFKMLKMEADIPSQIDHIFFSRPSFALREFVDCPDVEGEYPRQVQGGVNGLVIFTKKEVYMPPDNTWHGKAWQQMVLGNYTEAWKILQLKLHRIPKEVQGIPVSPSASEKVVRDPMLDMYPMSDHYGVAAMLGMRVDGLEPIASPVTVSAAAAAAYTPPTLTSDEVKVMITAVEYLESYVTTLRSQIRMTRIMAVTSVLIIITNLWVLRRLTAAQETHTAEMLEEMYDLASANAFRAARSGAPPPPQQPQYEQPPNMPPRQLHEEGMKTQVMKATRWVVRNFHIPLPSQVVEAIVAADDASEPMQHPVRQPKPMQDPEAVHQASPPAPTPTASWTTSLFAAARPPPPKPNFAAMAADIAARPLWASTWVSSTLNIAAAVIGTASFAIGMFQRAGNANILEEQVQQLRLPKLVLDGTRQ